MRSHPWHAIHTHLNTLSSSCDSVQLKTFILGRKSSTFHTGLLCPCTCRLQYFKGARTHHIFSFQESTLIFERELWPSFMHGFSICLRDLYELNKNVYKLLWKQQDDSFFLLWQCKRIVRSVTLDLTISCLYWKLPHKVHLMSDQTHAIWSY